MRSTTMSEHTDTPPTAMADAGAGTAAPPTDTKSPPKSPPVPEDRLVHKMLLGLGVYHTLALLLLFAPSGDIFWTEGWWAFLVPLLGHTAICVWEAKYVPSQLAEQWSGLDMLRTDVDFWDKLNTVAFMGVCPLLAFLTAGLCHRWNSGHLGLYTIVGSGAKLLALGGWGLVLAAIYTNDFASTAIRVQKDRGQRVVREGPYQYIRHPGYVGMALYSMALPFIVDCWYLIGWSGILVSLLVARTIREDNLLIKELPGYDDYVKRVPYRWVANYW